MRQHFILNYGCVAMYIYLFYCHRGNLKKAMTSNVSKLLFISCTSAINTLRMEFAIAASTPTMSNTITISSMLSCTTEIENRLEYMVLMNVNSVYARAEHAPFRSACNPTSHRNRGSFRGNQYCVPTTSGWSVTILW